ncbi:type II toxin-antitoxin system RelB/DinJ family antitoxin [Candidatus Saccharibacteria bacterium]|nr:type II toxin-antitoxin system RelB/DinJ family antitoxin [Candidatus Saccharibacteria bacterium]
MSTTVPTQIRIDANLKAEANELFQTLGMDMSGAVNIFLNQCVLNGGLPFRVVMPKYNKRTMDAIEEAEKITYDENVKGYDTMDEFRAAMLAEAE